MEMFVVEVESTSRDLSDSAIDHAMTALAEWHPSVGASLAGTLEATLTLPGEDLRQAVAAGVTAVTAAGLVPIAVSALPEKDRPFCHFDAVTLTYDSEPVARAPKKPARASAKSASKAKLAPKAKSASKKKPKSKVRR